MAPEKALTIKELTFLDSLKKALSQSPAEKIRLSLKLSNLCAKLFKATEKRKK